MFSVLVIRLRSLRLLRVSGIVMRLRMFLLLITFLKASHSFRNRRSEERFSRNAETDLVCRLLLEKKNEKKKHPRLQIRYARGSDDFLLPRLMRRAGAWSVDIRDVRSV